VFYTGLLVMKDTLILVLLHELLRKPFSAGQSVLELFECVHRHVMMWWNLVSLLYRRCCLN